MKLNIFIIITIFLFAGCAPKEIKKDPITPETKIENKAKVEDVSVGWSNLDTYTVKVVSDSIEKGKEKAKHQILQDIVKVRMLNESRFTDITKINAEFEKPLKNGRVISEKKVSNGIEIYYQIKDEGLKKKFEKK
jgi:hypothetical protein